ncbi:hypothetical protein AZE42_04619 [Rhizopogon vesiculosus]|uniref:tRNA (adenine(58)-N(1))-methyltransferase catalytic subunit TRM61 n=1 Tax=Rhizopogon vesiculosus TaxID=180088 RepID=A0A1J8QJV5_9AGAM|nr:hypothetical protein AZE42_04619 [Rhizopogon vesiculosus]
MWSTARDVAAGDLVIIWQARCSPLQTRELIQPLLITPGKDFNSRFGYYRHADIVGIPYGSKVGSRNGKGFIHVLRPTPELWTMALPHRTQILYLADIAFITSWLDIKRGSRVIEAGTGSGSFSHSIARTIGSAGHLWSYEFHEARANKAREEFSLHGMADIVTLTHRNVCKDGFTVEDTVDAGMFHILSYRLIARADCLFYSIPRPSGSVGRYRARKEGTEAPQPLAYAIEKLKKSEQKREEKRQNQIARSSKRKRDDLPETDAENAGGKRFKTQESAGDDVRAFDIPDPVVDQPANQPIKMSVSKACPEVRGHTSYLTFARLVPTAPATNRQ